jgi:hypothetical protein
MKFSRFIDGQEVSAYTQNDKPYTGRVYKNNEGIKVVVDEDGKWIKLTELKAVKQVGRKLNPFAIFINNNLNAFIVFVNSSSIWLVILCIC